jgi:type IV secretory pathway TrbD component
MTSQLTTASYYQSLNTSILIGGIDRSLLFLIMGLSLPIAFSGHLSPLMDIISGFTFAVLYLPALTLSRSNPQFILFYLRRLRYNSFYLAQPLLHVKNSKRCMSVPAFFSNREGI